MSISDELFEIAVLLENQSKILKNKEFDKPLQKLIDASKQVGEAWSGSWLGYQSRVYYANLVKPPSSARFSQEWGMKAIQGDWREFQYDDIITQLSQFNNITFSLNHAGRLFTK